MTTKPQQDSRPKKDDAPTAPIMRLFQRISAVRGDISSVDHDKWVGKKLPDGNPDLSDNYGYWVTSHNAVNHALRPLMAKYGLVDYVVLKQHVVVDTGRTIGQYNVPVHQYQGEYDYVVLNADDPDDVLRIPVQGYANDTQDKAPGKASTYAFKEGRRKLFSISTGDDEEGRRDIDELKKATDPALSDDQFDAITAFADETWGDDAETKLRNFIDLAIGPQLNINGVNEIPAKHFDYAMRLLKKQAKKDGRLPDNEESDNDD